MNEICVKFVTSSSGFRLVRFLSRSEETTLPELSNSLVALGNIGKYLESSIVVLFDLFKFSRLLVSIAVILFICEFDLLLFKKMYMFYFFFIILFLNLYFINISIGILLYSECESVYVLCFINEKEIILFFFASFIMNKQL